MLPSAAIGCQMQPLVTVGYKVEHVHSIHHVCVFWIRAQAAHRQTAACKREGAQATSNKTSFNTKFEHQVYNCCVQLHVLLMFLQALNSPVTGLAVQELYSKPPLLASTLGHSQLRHCTLHRMILPMISAKLLFSHVGCVWLHC